MGDDLSTNGSASSAPHLTVEAREDYLLARIAGVRTRESVSSVVIELARTLIDRHVSRVMVDVRDFKGHLGLFETYSVVTHDFAPLRGKGIAKAAFVDRRAAGAPDWFIETTARNRGFNIKVFDNPDSALTWLLDRATDAVPESG